MMRFLVPGQTSSGVESKKRVLRHHEDIFQYEEFLFGVLNEIANQTPCNRTPTSDKLALQDLEAILESCPLEPSVFLEKFVKAWSEDSTNAFPFTDEEWFDVRGEMGETVLNWTWLLKIRYSKHEIIVQLLEDLLESMLKSKPYLAGVAYDSEPRTGQTLLHQACAEGDVSLVQAIIDTGFGDLNRRMKNDFCKEMMKLPSECRSIEHLITPTIATLSHDIIYSKSPLEIAVIAPRSCEKSVAVVHMLLDAGADPIVYEGSMGKTLSTGDADPNVSQEVRDSNTSAQDRTSGKVLFTLLHVLARGRWFGDGPHHVSESRTKAILALLMDRESPLYQKVPSDMQNERGFTPLQAAAAFGNEVFFVEMLDWMKVYVQQWGSMHAYGFPLKELDSGASEDEFCALEVMALFNRTNLLNLGLCESIIRSKWAQFGLPFLRLTVLVEAFVVVCTAVVILDDTEGYHWVRWWCRLFALAVAISTIVFYTFLFVVCANNEPWFRHMPFFAFGTKHNRVAFSNLLAFSSLRHLSCMAIMVLTVPWYHHDWVQASPMYVLVWHTLVSIWWFDYILHTLRLLELDERTGPLAAALPEIFRKDMAPFLCIYSIIFLCSSIALRVATSAQRSSNEDLTVGTWWRTIQTLEEAIHGPDVQWRPLVQNHPAMAALVFITFLWCTLMMLTILVAMFSNRYDILVAHNRERLLFRRATFIITLEKLMPQWYHTRANLTTGRPLGMLVQHGKRLVTRRRRETSDSEEKLGDVSERTPLVGDDYADDRWVVVKGDDLTFNRWRSPHSAEDSQV